MFEPLSTLFSGRSKEIGATDLKYLVQNYLRDQLKSNDLYCHSVHDGVAVIRTVSPTLQQEIRLLEHDLKRELLKEADYTLKSIRVVS